MAGVLDGVLPIFKFPTLDGLARFAVDEHNKKENAQLEFARFVKAEEQDVAGSRQYLLTLEAIDAGKRKTYEAKVLVKPAGSDFKELQEFKFVADVHPLLDVSIPKGGILGGLGGGGGGGGGGGLPGGGGGLPNLGGGGGSLGGGLGS